MDAGPGRWQRRRAVQHWLVARWCNGAMVRHWNVAPHDFARAVRPARGIHQLRVAKLCGACILCTHVPVCLFFVCLFVSFVPQSLLPVQSPHYSSHSLSQLSVVPPPHLFHEMWVGWWRHSQGAVSRSRCGAAASPPGRLVGGRLVGGRLFGGRLLGGRQCRAATCTPHNMML